MDKMVYEGFVSVKETEVEMRGKKKVYNELVIKDAVAAIVLDEEGRFGIVKQYRPIIKKHTLEMIAETCDKDNLDALETIIEGLYEEGKISRDEITYINETPVIEYYMMMGCCKSMMSIYEIHVKKQCDKVIEDDDVEYVSWVTLDELKELIDKKEIEDSKTIMSYYYLLSKGK